MLIKVEKTQERFLKYVQTLMPKPKMWSFIPRSVDKVWWIPQRVFIKGFSSSVLNLDDSESLGLNISSNVSEESEEDIASGKNKPVHIFLGTNT